MHDLGRTLIFLGLLLVVVGIVVVGFNRLHLPLGRLPGDFNWRGKGWSFSFPLATSILVSVVLSLLLWVFGRLRR
jgi:ribose/xylose/arabinose/galactoside ABC-type transport system permease subunit